MHVEGLISEIGQIFSTYLKGNEMLFEIVYIHCGLWLGFQCYTGEVVKNHRNSPKMPFSREQKVKRRFKQHKWIKLTQY